MSYIPSGTGRVFLVDSDGIRHKVRIQTRTGFTAAEAPVETRRSLDQDEGERVSVGSPGPGSYAGSFEPNPFLSSNRQLRAFHANGGLCTLEEDRGGTPTVLQVGSDGVREIALAADGTLTSSGSAGINFGTEGAPRAPWTQGLGVILGGVLYIVDEILSATTCRASRWGAVTVDPRADAIRRVAGQRIALEDAVPLAAVNATASYQLVQMGVRSSQSGRVSQAGGDEASGAGEVTSDFALQLSSQRTLAALLPAA